MDDNIIQFPSPDDDGALDDDVIIANVKARIAQWQAAGMLPSLVEVQALLDNSISASASPMARDIIIAAILTAFGAELGTNKRTMISTWNKLEKDFIATRAQNARNGVTKPKLTAAQKAALRESLWPNISELAQAPDLIDRVVRQVQSMGVVNERDLIVLTYVIATSRVLSHPVNLLIKGVSGGGKSFTALHTLELIGSSFVNKLTSSSALSLVYDERPLANTVMVLFEANQMQASNKQANADSTFAMLVRTLISEGQIVHQTSVEDPNTPFGRRVERIVRSGPIALITTTTGELYNENETRMLSWNIHADREQTAAVIRGLADRAAGIISASASELTSWHDLQRWIALGPSEAVIPFAPLIAKRTAALMVRFRRDAGSLFSFIKASALLHQAQRQRDVQGRVIAAIDDYRLAYPIFSKVLSESSGKDVPENVRAVVKLIAARTREAKTKGPTKTMRFQRVEVSGQDPEITISSEQIGIETGIGKSAAKRAVNSGIDLGFLVNRENRERMPFRLVLKQDVDEVNSSLLPDPSTIEPLEGAEHVPR